MAKVCSNCSSPLRSGLRFCTVCGTPVPADEAGENAVYTAVSPDNAAPAPEEVRAKAPVSTIDYEYTAPASPTNSSADKNFDFKLDLSSDTYESRDSYSFTAPEPDLDGHSDPITPFGYVGIFFLMAIPVVNLILLIVWACGGCRKDTKMNFARGALLTIAICLLISIILAVLASVFAAQYIENILSTFPPEISDWLNTVIVF